MTKKISILKKLSFAKALPVIAIVGLAAVWFLLYQFGVGDPFCCSRRSASGGALSYRMHLRQLAEKTREFSEAARVHLATVEALATAIDARDQVGIGHVRRAQIYAVGMGRLLGLGEPDINALRTGALLHDIGKLAVPDHILNKPGGLTPAELEKTKIHSAVGASILEKVGFDYPVVPTVRYHHERWDGLGYPEGLKGEQIPLRREYSPLRMLLTRCGVRGLIVPAIPRDKARQIIQSEAGHALRSGDRVLAYSQSCVARERRSSRQGFAYDDAENVGNHFAEQIKLANKEVFSLYELAREFSSANDLKETLELFSSKVREFVPFDTCAVYLLDNTSGMRSPPTSMA